ncbi:hypothetical protein [Kitasatospora sp. GAS1066B]
MRLFGPYHRRRRPGVLDPLLADMRHPHEGITAHLANTLRSPE